MVAACCSTVLTGTVESGALDHARPDHGLADRLGVGGVGLVRLDEGLHVLGRDQPDLVAEGLQLPRPVVRARAGLDANQARRQPGEERGDLAAP
jgi:hypothetical protein